MKNFIEKIGLELYPCYGTMGCSSNLYNRIRDTYRNQSVIVINLYLDNIGGCQNEHNSFTQKYIRGEYNKYLT